MPALEGNPSPHRWNQIKRLPLHPGIRTLEQYEEAILAGTVDALDFLRGIDPLHDLSVADMGETHYQLFKGVHPWAGEFRRPGQMATIAGFPAADPQRISRELELASSQTREMLELAASTGDAQQVLAAIAFFHVRFERVHPFLDGNGRSGRAILAIQFEKAFGTLPQFSDQPGYREAIRASNRRDLAPLTNYLAASAGLPPVDGALRPAFHVNPRFLEGTENPTFEEDLARSRTVS